MTGAVAPLTHAVIIPHYNDTDRLGRCLNALLPQVCGGVEVVVADNASPMDMGPVAAQFPSVRFVTQPEKGAGPARNKGVEVTTAPGLIFLDADCVPGPGWLARACAVQAQDAVIRGRIDVFHETPPPRTGAEVFEEVFAFKQSDYIAHKGFSVTANLVTTRAVYLAAGPFVTGLSEDVDWCRRAVAAGASLRYDDALVVAHPSRQDWPALAKKWRRLTQEMYGLGGSRPKARITWALRALAMPLSAVVHAARIVRFDGLSGGERLAGIATLMRLRVRRGVWMLAQAMGRTI